ncbi:MAG: hydantoinase B/oxoprolinase family protein, partial [Alphaproteobacteria bacterium]|nr:hydantoinase B/oxoprolinase family protein [Alphaproteobacteria bacterium]
CLTTPADPSEAVEQGIQELLEKSPGFLSGVYEFIHGTTLVINAIIERKGARTGLITTKGFKDVLELGREIRYDAYDIFSQYPQPLIPRYLRTEVDERITSDGRVIRQLDLEEVRHRLAEMKAGGVESLAVCLINSYENPVHEKAIRDFIQAEAPDLFLSTSFEVLPQIREYERTCTTATNAYVKPITAKYLKKLSARLESLGFDGKLFIMLSSGGITSIETAREFPVRIIESGPTAAVIASQHYGRMFKIKDMFCFDMGGTTAKICLIDDGEPMLSRSFEVDRAHRFMKGSGTPVKIPVVEMVEIGAGGGSIAGVDALNRIQVGPHSAGAEPGPACYGQGGARPTVTDANLAMGRIDAEGFAGGTMTLDAAAARMALLASVGKPMDMDAIAAAEGVIEIVDENMASATRVHAVERGTEVAGRAMIAFGGAAPLHAARLAEKLGLDQVLVPTGAGVGSAIGFLRAPIAYEVVRSRYMRLSDFDAGVVNELFHDMREEAVAVVRLGAAEAALREARFAYARYVGQGHEIKVALPEWEFAPGADESIRDAFEREYERQYGRTVPGLDIEVLTWSATVSAERPTAASPTPSPAQAGEGLTGAGDEKAPLPLTGEGLGRGPTGVRNIHFPGTGEPLEAALYQRAALGTGDAIEGPAAIGEDQTTTIVPGGFSLAVNERGDLVLERGAAGARPAAGATASGIRDQVIWDRLIAIVEEQAQALIRTAFSTTVREAGDLSAGMFDLQGRMLAQAVTGTPGHVNAMAASVNFFLEKYPAETMEEGDVYLTNDPWMGTGHLYDFTVVTPAFRGGEAVALFASTVHVVDIGGAGFGPDAGQVYEEGLCIPILPLFKCGEANETVLEIVRANVREPVQVVGDLYSLTACNAVGARRLVSLMDEFGLNDVEGIGDRIIETSRAAMIKEIAKLPAGIYENEMTVDGYDRPVTYRARLEIKPDAIEVSFDGTSAMSSYGINSPLTYTQAYTSFGIRCVVGNMIPNNTGSLGVIRVTAPQGSILNAPRPAAVNIRHVTGQMLPDVVLGCLEKAKPGIAPAEGASSLWNPMLSGGRGITGEHDYGDARSFSVTIFHSGGT